DVPCSDNLLKTFGEQYRKVRNTLRFLMSNLSGYTTAYTGALVEVDEWILEQTDLLVDECVRAYGEYDFGKVITSVHNFCVNEL
ncbi:class I tRNA ligase family protein, partial [Acinetobacter baumannii]